MKDVTDNQSFDIVPPSASSMIESMRAYGYSLSVAIADLIDNSISAGAHNVSLFLHWAGEDSWIRIADDGMGMSEIKLVTAMRLGSKSPLEERLPSDLGRFGLGMKTASFSQCRRMTVRSFQAGRMATRRWDLDYIASNAGTDEDGWRLLLQPAAESEDRLQLLPQGDGTIVLWEKLDRLTANTQVGVDEDHNAFLRHIGDVRRYLSMVFHRFLQGPKPRLRIYLNGSDKHHQVEHWDPFLKDHLCTQSTPKESIQVGSEQIEVTGFILPHRDRLTPELHRAASGPGGWNAQQGFYVYRNERLLVAGDWLGLGNDKQWTKEEHYKLARIQLDIPNTMDNEWQIDVKKSVAIPPAICRGRLLSLAKSVRQIAREVFAHRGAYGPRTARAHLIRPWLATMSADRPKYRIDRNHPLIAEALRLSDEKKRITEAAFQVIEETVPVQRIWLDVAEKPGNHLLPFEDRTQKEIKRLIRYTYEAWRETGLSPQESIDRLRCQEEFRDYSQLIDQIKD